MNDPIPSRSLMAILRGITPDESVDVGRTLVELGITLIEVPMNSPAPFESVSKLVSAIGDVASIGGGTVTELDQVADLAAAGGQFVVSPNCDPTIIGRTKELGMTSYPGVFTASECFLALKSGADALKLFPASLVTPAGLAALRATLPPETRFFAVGGIGPDDFRDWLVAGIEGFGIGSSIYRPGRNLSEIRQAAQACVEAFDRAREP